MIKRNLWKAIIASIVTLLPIAVGVIFWDSLPDITGTHFGPSGTADGYASKLFAVLFIPLFMLVMHWICLAMTYLDNKKNGQSEKVLGIVLWICPIISLFSGGIIYAAALGLELEIMSYGIILLGALFTIIGNYLPKCKRNRTMGIKLPWTLSNDENWGATHRLGGKVWFFGGFAIMLMALLPIKIALACFLIAVITLVTVPTVYSYIYYKKQLEKGEITKGHLAMKRSDKIALAVTLPLVVLILVLCIVICFTGKITATMDKQTLTMSSTYYGGISINYKDIDFIEYRESGDLGERVWGFGTPRLSLGKFECEEFGSYTRYTYTDSRAFIVIEANGETFAVSLASDEATRTLYEALAKQDGVIQDR